MAKKNDTEQSYIGCYGEHISYAQLDDFLDDSFQSNRDAEAEGCDEKFATCIWGLSGIGKTAKVKQYCKKPVCWGGQQYSGYKVFDVPIAQFEEMGDLHGMPSRHVMVAKAGNGEPETRWVAEEVLQAWIRKVGALCLRPEFERCMPLLIGFLLNPVQAFFCSMTGIVLRSVSSRVSCSCCRTTEWSLGNFQRVVILF